MFGGEGEEEVSQSTQKHESFNLKKRTTLISGVLIRTNRFQKELNKHTATQWH